MVGSTHPRSYWRISPTPISFQFPCSQEEFLQKGGEFWEAVCTQIKCNLHVWIPRCQHVTGVSHGKVYLSFFLILGSLTSSNVPNHWTINRGIYFVGAMQNDTNQPYFSPLKIYLWWVVKALGDVCSRGILSLCVCHPVYLCTFPPPFLHLYIRFRYPHPICLNWSLREREPLPSITLVQGFSQLHKIRSVVMWN